VHHLTEQWHLLCELTGVDPVTSGAVLSDLLGDAGQVPLSAGPAHPSGIADDHTPVEFSVAFQPGGPALRLLAEAQPIGPGQPGLDTADAFLRRQEGRPGLSRERLDRVWDLFGTPSAATFGMWHSAVFRRGEAPEFKVYLDPEMHGTDQASEVVTEALKRLGLDEAWPAIRSGLRDGDDRLTFFALDLHDGPRTRIKIYVSHPGAEVTDVMRAARTVEHVDPAAVAAFCTTAAGDPGTFDRRPLISSFTLAPGADRPVGYSVYVPIRSYVADDEEARERVVTLLARHGLDGRQADRAIGAVARRPLRDGVGLIAHVSLRLGRPTPGVTVYLSAEAYRTDPPRPRLRPTR
jgi:DMATS type aromatic prenyltransferase